MNKRLNLVLRILCLIVALASAAGLVWQWSVHQHGLKVNDAMRALFDPSAGAEELAPREQFQALLDANPDTVGWLKATETIDFAVVQRDNVYYLDHNFFGESAVEGAAFLDEGNTLFDQHLLIHGHNMKNGTVFGDLEQFREEETLAKYPSVTFSTLYEDRVYVPIAVFDMSADPGNSRFFEMQQFNFETDEAFMEYVNAARARSYYQFDVDVQPGDHLLSLVTCSYKDENGRFVLMLASQTQGV